MTVESERDLEALFAVGRVVRAVFETMKAAARPGMTTGELDEIGAAALAARGAHSAPRLMYDFPGATCISVNEEAAHGIPGARRLAPGDMINIDVSAELDGYVADMGESFVLPPVTPERARICRAVCEAVRRATARAQAGRSLNVIGQTVQRIADGHGYAIVENLGSHGVGRSLHEEPSYVPLHNPRERRRLHHGQVLTIEPFFTTGTPWVTERDDGWTLEVPRGALVAQYEQTVVVTKGRALVVTA
jgi:methionyl aminopeptidase